MRRLARRVMLLLIVAALVLGLSRGHFPRFFPWSGARRSIRVSLPRPAKVRVPVDPRTVRVDDGDTIRIDWPGAPRETVRLLGIDAPEIHHPRNPGSVDQPYGRESLEFARRRILGARRLELLRASHGDRFGRTLGYLFVDGLNYSVLAIENHLAESTIGRFGDSGFPEEAAAVSAAARRAGAMPFESPVQFRDRTRASPGKPASRPTLRASSAPPPAAPG
jgi:endonuclease YncB( thermonuclease family)